MCLTSYVNNKGADQPAHPLASVAAQAGLCLESLETPKDTFCRVVALFYYLTSSFVFFME